jgi:hypothetical protein
LYAEGVKAKLQQAIFCLDNLQTLDIQQEEGVNILGGSTGPTQQELLTIDQMVSFYCESLWTSLRATLDILSQLINQVCSLGINEKSVDFKKVSAKLTSITSGTLLEKAVMRCLSSKEFQNLEEYRHCSTHRRQVYIQTRETTVQISGTPGYESYSGSSEQRRIQRYLCRNPWALTPNVDDSRPVVRFCEGLLLRISKHFQTITYHLP